MKSDVCIARRIPFLSIGAIVAGIPGGWTWYFLYIYMGETMVDQVILHIDKLDKYLKEIAMTLAID